MHVLNSHPFTSGAAHMGHVRSYSIGDAHARFRRARGDAVLYSLGFDAFGLPAELGALEHELPPREWVDTCAARMREQFDAPRLLVRLVAHLHELRRGHLPLVAVAVPRAARGRPHLRARGLGRLVRELQDGALPLAGRRTASCWRCHGPVRLVRRSQWYVRGSVYAEENDRRLAELTRWNKGALGAQRSVLGRVDGVELDAEDARRRDADALHAPRRRRVAAPSSRSSRPTTPRSSAGRRSRACASSSPSSATAGGQRDDRKLEEVAFVETGRSVIAPGIPHPLPVLISPSVDARFGPTAVLGIPSVDRTDEAIFEQLDPGAEPAGAAAEAPLVTRPAKRFRAVGLPDLAPARLGRADPDRPLRRLRDGAGAARPASGAPARRPDRHGRGKRAARQARLHRVRVPGVRKAGAARDGHARLPLRRGVAAASRSRLRRPIADAR